MEETHLVKTIGKNVWKPVRRRMRIKFLTPSRRRRRRSQRARRPGFRRG